MRTRAQELDFAKACMAIERSGGDVQEYIRINYPSYTPRAVWYRLQRDYLGRNTEQLTEGLPTKVRKERKEEDDMRKTKSNQADTAQAVINCLQTGGNVRECLEGLGFANLPATLRNVKIWIRKNWPEYIDLVENVRLELAKPKPKEALPEPVEEKPVENQAEEKKAPETNQLPVCAVKSRVKGEWHLSPVQGCVHLIWEDKITHEERSIGLPADDWTRLAEEIPLMLMQLGLAN